MQALVLDIPVDHPAFAGHFPGHPVVPGVVLLDCAQRALEAASGQVLVGLVQAKFHSPARPGQRLTLSASTVADTLRFEIHHETRKIADGRFRLAPGAQP